MNIKCKYCNKKYDLKIEGYEERTIPCPNCGKDLPINGSERETDWRLITTFNCQTISSINRDHINTDHVVSELDQSIKQNLNNEYLQGLKELTKQLDKEFKTYNVPEEKKTEINKSILDLEEELKDIKPETKVENLSLSKQKQIDAKTTTLIEKIVDTLPEASETIINLTTFSSLFSKFIRGGVQNLVDAYKKYKESQS